MIKIEIDGKELEVHAGSTIIQAADNAQIPIPRFCYHKKLSVAANCRMCLVEVEKAPKPMPACATPVMEGMVIKTKSPTALMAQRSVMEFLLINHPLDCPICDQGGECELQDVAMGYGDGISRFNLGKRSVADEDIGPLIATGMTRCIHCTRCVRFGEEVAGFKELGLVGRGEDTEIRSFLNNSIDSELSGNLIDVCPVGALTSKPYRFTARAWEMQQFSSIAPHDIVGSNIYIHSIRNKIKRVVPRENEKLNEVWLSDRDRFSYEGLLHHDRLYTPMAKINNKLTAISWEQALKLLSEYITDQIQVQPNDLIGFISSNATIEEGYLLNAIVNKLSGNSIHRTSYSQSTIEQTHSNGINGKLDLAGIANKSDSILLVGGSIRKSIPMLNHRVRIASLRLNGSKINVLSPVSGDYNFNIETNHIVHPSQITAELLGILKAVAEKSKNKFKGDILDKLNETLVSEQANKIADDLISADYPVVILNQLALSHPDADKHYHIIQLIKLLTEATTVIGSLGGNTIGLESLGINAFGSSNTEQGVFNLANKVGTYLLYNTEPEYDFNNDLGRKALNKLRKANKVISLTPFLSDSIREYADLVLPIATFAETSGTFVNLQHEWQSFTAAISADKIIEDSKVRPGWQVLTAIGRILFNSEDNTFAYQSSQEVRLAAESYLKRLNENKEFQEQQFNSHFYIDCLKNFKTSLATIKEQDESNTDKNIIASLVTEPNCYCTDNIVRRAISLQQTKDAEHGKYIFISKNLATKLNMAEDDELAVSVANIDNLDNITNLKAKIDNDLVDNTAYMTTGYRETLALHTAYSHVVIARND